MTAYIHTYMHTRIFTHIQRLSAPAHTKHAPTLYRMHDRMSKCMYMCTERCVCVYDHHVYVYVYVYRKMCMCAGSVSNILNLLHAIQWLSLWYAQKHVTHTHTQTSDNYPITSLHILPPMIHTYIFGVFVYTLSLTHTQTNKQTHTHTQTDTHLAAQAASSRPRNACVSACIHVCMLVHLCIYIYQYIPLCYVYICTRIWVHAFILCIHMYTFMRTCLYVMYTHVYIYQYMSSCMYKYMSTCRNACVWACKHVCMLVHLCIHFTYVYIT
jgi:hypothetical protein